MKSFFVKCPVFLLAFSLFACGKLGDTPKQAAASSTSSNVTADGCYPLQMAGAQTSADVQKIGGFSVCPVATNVKAVHVKYTIPAGSASVCLIPYNYDVSTVNASQSEFCFNLGASGTQVVSWGLTYNAVAVVEMSKLQGYKTALAYGSGFPAYAIVKFR